MASFQVDWKKSAQKELHKLPRQIIPRIVAAVDDLANDPYPHGMRKLVGTEHTYRIRVGDYRVIYDIFENKLIVEIIRVRHRREVYK
jgi:mRNA interferase RelE/StbE